MHGCESKVPDEPRETLNIMGVGWRPNRSTQADADSDHVGHGKFSGGNEQANGGEDTATGLRLGNLEEKAGEERFWAIDDE